MRELLEQGWGNVGIAGIAGIGVLVRLLLLGYYGRLSSACRRFESTGNKTIAYIRADLKKREERKQEIKNILTYTEYRLAERRILGFRTGSLEGMVPYSLLLTGVSCILLSLAGALVECGYKTMLHMLFAGGVSAAGLIILDVVTGLKEKNKRVRLGIRDYIENSRAFYTDQETKEEAEETKRALLQKKADRPEKREERKTDKPKCAGKKKHGKAQEEKRRLTEELLRERRQLEAKSLAEQRRKEREEEYQAEQGTAEAAVTESPAEQVQEEAAVTESPAEQVQAEAAVTESPAEQVQTEGTKTKCPELSYEALLNEFLAELSL